MSEKEFVAHKMPILIKEGYKRAQAYIIAKSMYSKSHKQEGGEQYAQQGLFNTPQNQVPQTLGYTPESAYQFPNQGYDFNAPYQGFNPAPLPQAPTFGQTPNFGGSQYQVPQTVGYDAKNIYNTPISTQSGQGTVDNTQYYDTNRVNIVNPYSGTSLEYALSSAGQGFGSGDYFKGGVGAGLSVLKGARNFMSGFGTGKENKRVEEEYFNKRFDNTPNYTYAQQGKEITNADVIAQNAITDQGQGNVNLEGGELVMRNTGQVQPVVGDGHIKNGKISDGVDAQLNAGDKVLSNYVKLKAGDIKELKDRYNISLNKGVTFAEAQKKIDQKLGIKKLETEKADILESIEKASNIKDKNTQQLNLDALTQKITGVNEKLNTLSGVRANSFEFLFQRQEKQEKKGDGSQLFDKNGKEITETDKTVAQQGGQPILPLRSPEEEAKRMADMERYKLLRASAVRGAGVKSDYVPIPLNTEAERLEDMERYKDLRSSILPGYKVDTGYRPDVRTEAQAIQDYQMARNNGIAVTPPVTTLPPLLQQGGEIEALASKHGISVERAMELMQQGGEQSGSQDQVFQAVAEMLQQGATPEQVLEQLTQQGIPQEQAVQIVQQVAQQMQAPQEQAPEEVAQQGGEKVYAQQAPPKGYTFSTRYKPTLKDYEAEGLSVLDQDVLADVEPTQHYKTGVGYGEKMADVEKTIALHDWYFDTEAKKKAFREAVAKEGSQPEVKAFQEAYNKEIERRAEDAGIPKDETSKIKKEVGFSSEGVQKVDGLFGAFTSTRPLYNFSKKDGEVAVIPEATPAQQEIIQRTNVKNVMPNFGTYVPLFSANQPIAKESIDIPRIEPIKQTVEPYLAAQEQQRQADVARIEQSGMSPQQQEAVLGQGLASSQLSANDAIAKVEQYNAQNQFAADQYNLGAQAKEDIMNAQFRQDYQNKVMQTLSNQEESMRNQYRTAFLQDQANANKVIDLNRINMLSDQFAITPSGMEVLNNRPFVAPYSGISPIDYSKMTPAEIFALKKKKQAELYGTPQSTTSMTITKP